MGTRSSVSPHNGAAHYPAVRALHVALFLVLCSTCARAQLTTDLIEIDFNHSLPAALTPISRSTVGQRGHYKPWVTQLSTGELLMVGRCDPSIVDGTKVPNCTAHGGIGPFAAVLWRAPEDLSRWTRTTQLRGGAGPFMTGVEFSIHALADDTIIVLTGLPENCTHYRSTDGGYSFKTQTIPNCTRCAKTAACWHTGNGASYNLIDVPRNHPGALPHGAYMFANNAIWRSFDSAASWVLHATATQQGGWTQHSDNFFEQTGTPFLAPDGKLLHATRVGIDSRWDQTDGAQLFESVDGGRSWRCLSNPAANFCLHNDADPHQRFRCACGHPRHPCPKPGAKYSCTGMNASFGGTGDMWPKMLSLADGRTLLTFTKRCSVPVFDTHGVLLGAPCRYDGHGTGLRALLMDKGDVPFRFDRDYLVLSQQTDAYDFFRASGCECGFGNTIQLRDGSLVSVYCYANAAEINATKVGAPQGTHVGVLHWRLPQRSQEKAPYLQP